MDKRQKLIEVTVRLLKTLTDDEGAGMYVWWVAVGGLIQELNTILPPKNQND